MDKLNLDCTRCITKYLSYTERTLLRQVCMKLSNMIESRKISVYQIFISQNMIEWHNGFLIDRLINGKLDVTVRVDREYFTSTTILEAISRCVNFTEKQHEQMLLYFDGNNIAVENRFARDIHHMECLRRHIQYNPQRSCHLTINAAYVDNVEMLDYLHQHKIMFDPYIWMTIAENDSINCLRYLAKVGLKIYDPEKFVDGIMYNNSVNCYTFYCESKNWPLVEKLCKYATNIEQLEYLYSIQPTMEGISCFKFVYYDDAYKMIKYAHKRGAIIDNHILDGTTCKGDIRSLRYCYENSSLRNISETYMYAAYHDRMECLLYLHNNGERINESHYVELLSQGKTNKAIQFVIDNH